MFDLENSIKQWLNELRKYSSFEDGDIAEIEDHIRDEIDRGIHLGNSKEKAFNKAVSTFGSGAEVGKEMYYAKSRIENYNPEIFKQEFPKSGNPLLINITMFQNNIKVALRNFLKNKVYGTINLSGLIIGMVSCLIISLYVFQELSYDGFHNDSDNIYRVQMNRYDGNELLFESAVTFPAVGPALKNDLPETNEFLRILPFGTGIYRYSSPDGGIISFNEIRSVYADANFFTLFNFKLLKGNPQEVLNQPMQIVLSNETAKRYFNEVDPIGKSINFRGEDFVVSGVMENMPVNSHMNFDIIISLSSWNNYDQFEEIWGWYDFYTFVKLDPGSDNRVSESKMTAFMRKYNGELYDETGRWETLHLQPITGIHLYSNLNWDMGDNGGGDMIYFLMVIAGIILIIAWVNFINLSTARAIKRAREVGVRKSVGAQKRQLMGQFMMESFLYNLIAIMISVGLTYLILPYFNSANDLSISVQLISSKIFILSLLAVLVLGTLASGTYPAFLLTSFRPSIVLKGKVSKQPGSNLFRKILVVFQFAASVILILGTVTVVRQMKFMKSQDLGINIDQTLVLNALSSADSRQEMEGRVQKLKNELLLFPSIKSFAMSSDVPGTENFGIGPLAIKSKPESLQDTYRVFVDYSFFEDMEVEFLSGRNYSTEFVTDTSAVIINDVAMRQFQIESPEKAMDEIIVRGDNEFRIIGVIKSYHEASLREELNPSIYYLSPRWENYLCLKISTKNLDQTLAQVKGAWKSSFPDAPLDYFFLDQHFNQHYRADERFNNIFMTFAAMAVFVACLGLFGLVSFTAEQSVKEISIRKVLGSSVQGIVFMLSKDFIKLIIIALIIAFPVAYLIMQQWLTGFAYKTDLSPFIFVFAGVVTLSIAIFTVSFQSLKAARTNPAEILKNE